MYVRNEDDFEILRRAEDMLGQQFNWQTKDDEMTGLVNEDVFSIIDDLCTEIDMLKEQLMSVLETLTPREQKVIRLRYGLDDAHPRTLEEVGREFSVTRERIRQIEAKALRKLRQPSKLRKLREFEVSTFKDFKYSKDGIVIGAEKKGSNVEVIATSQLHALIVGTTGSGKTTGL